MKNQLPLPFLFILTLFIVKCDSPKNEEIAAPEFISEIEEWRAKRVENLIKPNGWAALAGLFWLEEGENTFGSNKENNVVFPKSAPENMGSFHLENDSVYIKINPEIEITLNDSVIYETGLRPDVAGNPNILHHKSMNWNLIKRGDKYGIRLRDTLHENRQNFKGIDYFPIAENWKLEAVFEEYEGGKEMKFKNVLDMETDQKVEGRLVFKVGEETCALDVLNGGDEDFFVIFADETTGDNTYGGGRYIYVPRPENRKTFIDFNKAYTPPCGFTDFATCLLPPAQNRLAVSINAGEQYHGHGHGH